MKQILLFGDSITQQSFSQERGFAFGAALSDFFVRRRDVVNRGFSGYNTRQALKVLPHVVPLPEYVHVDLMAIFFGANDARLPESLGGFQQHVPLEEYKHNVRAIVRHPRVQAHSGIRIVLITPPPVDERKSIESDQIKYPDMPENVRRKAAVTAQYARAIRELGEELNVQVLDFWSALIVRAGGDVNDAEPIGSRGVNHNEVLQSYLHDGLHMTPEGYRVLYEEFMALLVRAFPDFIPERQKFALPAWDDQEAWNT